MKRVVAVGLCISLVGCTAWPKPAAITSPQLASSPIRTIDILPLDLEVWAHQGYARPIEGVRTLAETSIVGVITNTIRQHGYAVNALVGWNGTYPGPGGAPATALAPTAVVATLDSLASYGSAVDAKAGTLPAQYRAKPVELPFPYLPARLGERTGADATLYVGGWGFVGEETHSAETVIAVVFGVILVVGIIAVLASSKGDGAGKIVDGVASAGKGLAHGAVSVGRLAAKTAVAAGQFALENPDLVVAIVDDATDTSDAFGHSSTHVALVPAGRPEYANDPNLPRAGKAEMYLEMTLVDNRTGVALWHVHQRFPANASKAEDVARATRAMIATLPRFAPHAVAAR